jgi:riboflavin kinase/FMN adenylyltransferase
MNIGTRPTFEAQDDGTVHLELHIPAIQADLYGQDVEVSFIRKLRDERKFGSEDELREQIARDVAAALACLGKEGKRGSA